MLRSWFRFWPPDSFWEPRIEIVAAQHIGFLGPLNWKRDRKTIGTLVTSSHSRATTRGSESENSSDGSSFSPGFESTWALTLKQLQCLRHLRARSWLLATYRMIKNPLPCFFYKGALDVQTPMYESSFSLSMETRRYQETIIHFLDSEPQGASRMTPRSTF